MGTTPSMPPLHHRQAVDDALDAYLEWRQQCAAVWDAYGNWAGATSEDKRAAYAVYQAALDREGAAANVYATVVDRVSDLLAPTALTANPPEQKRQ